MLPCASLIHTFSSTTHRRRLPTTKKKKIRRRNNRTDLSYGTVDIIIMRHREISLSMRKKSLERMQIVSACPYRCLLVFFFSENFLERQSFPIRFLRMRFKLFSGARKSVSYMPLYEQRRKIVELLLNMFLSHQQKTFCWHAKNFLLF